MPPRVIIALDFPEKEQVDTFMSDFKGRSTWVKVGMELFYKEGPSFVETLKEQGHSVFLDLKLHDIPTTVHHGMRNLGRLGIDLVTVHAAGGSEMMRAAVEGLEEGSGQNERPKCVAVTQLTSTSDYMLTEELGWQGTMQEAVMHYAKLSQNSHLDGVVCSAHEASMLRDAFGPDFWTVTPGIRLKGDALDDQKRVMTPGEARKAGSTAIVVGRSITQKNDPLTAYQTVVEEWERVSIEDR
ncbi:orotidine-5'-phosphate decarboxylase [Bacillaceae bacterium SIJ1]|uniref:orotidine-5'-phosphate decarboxylase n=1 Tax=Litoribacterium kuwaitense TaxID=1398745 RepID=UPI0013EA3D5D|nr:orotidine-5'-phosphate decarboxylase [Litoribacterium kuwaitense]NGP44314.1 orotidine-5'-phosphate decarboxylase [Litoribacterium kuwaitense]